MTDAAQRGAPTPPIAARRPQERHAHGVAWVDDYAWIRADNWREVLRDPAALPADIRALLEAENAYADAVLAPTRALQRQLAREMRARLKEDDSEVPQSDGALRLLLALPPWRPAPHLLPQAARRRQGDDPHRRRRARRGQGVLPPDPRPLVARPSPARLERRRQGLGDVRDPRARPRRRGRTLPIASRTRPAKRCGPPTRSGFLYVEQDEDHRPWRVMLHRLGDAAERRRRDLRGSRSGLLHRRSRPRLGRAAMISVHGHDSSETHVVDLGDPAARPRLIAPRRPGFRYEAMDHGDVFYIRANSGGAADFQIVVAPREAPEEANWRPFVPHKPGRLIERATLFKDFLVLLAREDNVPHLVVHALAERRARTRSPSRRRPTRWRSSRSTNSTRRPSASASPRWPAARRSTTTISSTASASCARSRRRRRISTPRPM